MVKPRTTTSETKSTVGETSRRSLSSLRGTPDTVVAVLCSDLHLSLKPPIARSCEQDWLKVQTRYLNQLGEIADKHEAPIICAGDVFDRWNSPPELINFAIRHVPCMYAIPGQHDLPLHNYKDIRKSAYWTLVQAGVIKNIEPDNVYTTGMSLRIVGFPWGSQLVPYKKPLKETTRIAVAHQYIWDHDHSHPGASEEKQLTSPNFHDKLKGYSVALFGDNHSGFMSNIGKTSVLNCGTFMRRKLDERGYKPRVGLLYGDGRVEAHYLDVSKDKFLKNERLVQTIDAMPELSEFVEELMHLGDTVVNFGDTVREALKNKQGLSKLARNLVAQCLEELDV